MAEEKETPEPTENRRAKPVPSKAAALNNLQVQNSPQVRKNP